MLRILIVAAVLLLCIATIGSAQIFPIPTGTICTPTGQNIAYIFPTDIRCCTEMVEGTATNPTQCAENCALGSYDYIYGYYRNNTYDTCVCLYCWQADVTNPDDFLFFIRHETGKTATPEIQDLVKSAVLDVELKNVSANSSAQLVLEPNQIALIQTSVAVSGNLVQFIARPSVSGLSIGSNFVFTARDIYDYNYTTEAAKFRNNSFAIANFAERFFPAVQYKRQTQSQTFTYTMKNLGSEVLVVLSADNVPLASWYYSALAYNTDSTIATLNGQFTFNLDVEFSSSVLYTPCSETRCTGGNILEVCQNQSLVERKFCYLGCDDFAQDCLQCNSTTCQGTCSTNSTCACSETQIGTKCDLDISTSTFLISGSITARGRLVAGANAIFELVNWQLLTAPIKVCGTLSYTVQSMDYMGMFTLLGSCCTAPLKLREIRRSTESQSQATLVLAPDSEWTCFQGDMNMDSQALDNVYELTVQSSNGYSNNNYWQWKGNYVSENEAQQVICDGSDIDQNTPSMTLPALATQIGVTFLVVCCVAVAGGFVGGFFLSPRGMTVKKRGQKGCLPKSNAALSRSIIAMAAVDVGAVTIMNLVGALVPISAMVLASGILVAIMTYQFEHVGARFGNKLRRVYQLQKVERVFGRLSAAFLIIIGVALLLNEIVFLVGGMLNMLSYFFAGMIGWFYVALYVIWAFVAVHFAGAIYISVCYYYTAARTDHQEAIKDDKVELSERSETEP